MIQVWQLNQPLSDRSRLQGVQRRLNSSTVAQLGMLLLLGGIAAAFTAVAASPLRLPGHAILRGTLPLCLGLSLAPRVAAGSLMSASAAALFGMSLAAGLALPPLPAIVGVLCLGPALDLATWRLPAIGYRVYLRFALAGLAANLAAFVARMLTSPAIAPAMHGSGMGAGGGNGMGMGRGTGMGRAAHAGAGLAASHPTAALVSFALFGAIAGLVCGIVWFRARPHHTGEAAP